MGAAESRIACAIWLLACSPALAAQPGGFNLGEVKPGVFVHLGRQLALDAPGRIPFGRAMAQQRDFQT